MQQIGGCRPLPARKTAKPPTGKNNIFINQYLMTQSQNGAGNMVDRKRSMGDSRECDISSYRQTPREINRTLSRGASNKKMVAPNRSEVSLSPDFNPQQTTQERDFECVQENFKHMATNQMLHKNLFSAHFNDLSSSLVPLSKKLSILYQRVLPFVRMNTYVNIQKDALDVMTKLFETTRDQ